MYKCSKSKLFFVCLRQIGLFTSSWVTVVEYVNPCITHLTGWKQQFIHSAKQPRPLEHRLLERPCTRGCQIDNESAMCLVVLGLQ